MAVPKKRKSRISRDMRRSHLAKTGLKLATCSNCGSANLPHTACSNCGTYKGREVIDITKKLTKQERKRKEKARDQNQQ